MTEEAGEARRLSLTQERHAWRARFMTRFNRYKNLITKRWWVLLAGAGLGMAVQAMVWRFETPLYVSAGRMIVNLKLSIPEGSLYTEELNNFLGTQAALMQSGVVINRAHARAGALHPEFEQLPISLKALILPKTTIFVLQGFGQDSQYTRDFVQACMEEYINLKKEMRTLTSDSTLAGMTDEAVRIEKELRKSDDELAAFQSTNSVVLLQDQGNSAGNFLASLNQRLATLSSEYSLLQMLTLDQNLEREQQPARNLPVINEAPEASDVSTPIGLVDSDYLRARQQLLLLRAEQDDLAHYLRPKHPKIIALADEIARRERLLAIFRQQSAEQMQSRRESLKLQILNLETDVQAWEGRALQISRHNAEFERLKANSRRTQALYDRLLATMQTLDVNKEISPESVTIMEKAGPGVADRSGLGKKLIGGGLTGLALSILLLGLIDRLDDRVNSFSELQELFDEEVLGQVPREKSALRPGQRGLLAPQDERYAYVEAYRNLRSSLLYMAGAGQRPKTLLVTSSVPNDGKSITSANLGITLASAGSRVLLVDADLRKGSLHNRFGVAAGVPGLSEALGEQGEPAGGDASRGEDWAGSVQPTRFANLYLLPRGQTTHRSSELFLSPRAPRFLRQAAEAYDFVILDTAPVMAADDVTSLAPQVDGVIFVVRAEHTSARVARAALDLLYLRHVRVLGLVFNAVRPTSVDYYGYYKYKDYAGNTEG